MFWLSSQVRVSVKYLVHDAEATLFAVHLLSDKVDPIEMSRIVNE